MDHQHGKLAPCGDLRMAARPAWLVGDRQGMRELFREELARHAEHRWYSSPAYVALPKAARCKPGLHYCSDFIAPKVAGCRSPGCSAPSPGHLSLLQDDMPFLDGEVPAVNGM